MGHEAVVRRVFGIVGLKDAVHSGRAIRISPLWCASTAWMVAVEIVPCTGIDERELIGRNPNALFLRLGQQFLDAVY